MTVLAGLLGLAAVFIVAAVAVPGSIAATAELLPPWTARGDEAVSARTSSALRPLARGRSEATRTRA
jgi:hypothetical protein